MPSCNGSNAAERLKTAIASEENNILGMTSRFIAESTNYALQRTPEASYDLSRGFNPRHVRMSTAPLADHAYIDMFAFGDSEDSMQTRLCDGNNGELTTDVNDRGAWGCHIPAGPPIQAGFDEYRRIMKGKAWETPIICTMDLVERGPEHASAYINMLREDLPRRAVEQFEYAIENLHIENSIYNGSVSNSLQFGEGYFPYVPTGRLSIGYLKRVRDVLMLEDPTFPFEVAASREAVSMAIRDWKQDTGSDVNTTPLQDDRIGLEGVESFMFEGIIFRILKKPVRGYLRPGPVPGQFEFVRVTPNRARVGTGGGLVSEINPDYYSSFYFCDGQRHDMVEVAMIINPKSARREGLNSVSIAGQGWDSALFNFQLRLIDGSFIDCNYDNFKLFYRMLHAFAFQPLNPEFSAMIVHQYQPEIINLHAAEVDADLIAETPITPDDPPMPNNDCCSEGHCAEGTDLVNDPIVEPSQTEPCPVETTGIIRLVDCGPLEVLPNDTVQIGIERVDGYMGAADVQIDTANDTAMSGTNYTAIVAATVSWLDGEGGVKYVTLTTLDNDGATNLALDLTLSNATGATLADGTTTGCNTMSIEILPE